ncbi:hypothetical protein A6A29_38725 [Streptomyces sp. TSRI0281]|nr:hypothetical protein A6A29_38725 [Streptomyces sp. TSRI0281]
MVFDRQGTITRPLRGLFIGGDFDRLHHRSRQARLIILKQSAKLIDKSVKAMKISRYMMNRQSHFRKAGGLWNQSAGQGKVDRHVVTGAQ